MAANKAKRSIPSAQPERHSPHPKPVELMPVKAHVYRAIAELNGGFEKILHDLQTLSQVSFFRSGSVTTVSSQISRIRAQVNREFAMTLHDREMANAGHFDHLCAESEKKSPPNE